ncbi:MAG: phosphatidylserine decarboxylase family protein [Deltaproteobacteria bacterium]|nr:phosphatidylserine decarboxylase family protein [Deltaproteobacteria bacterium]
MKHLQYPIALEGLFYIGLFFGFFVVSLFLLPFIWILFFVGLFLWSLWFFRNPRREFESSNENLVVSPADGQIVAIGPALENHFLKQEMMKMSIFMNVFSVHVNRAPLNAHVANVVYKQGKFLMAHHKEASLENEQNALLLHFKDTPLVLVQIAGKIARRIISYADIGTDLQRGEAFGLIKFGSRVDLYLPLNSTVKVKAGEKVKSGETVLAEIL